MNNLDPTPIISLRDVSMAYDSRRVLSAVNLDIARGDFVAVTGPNGGGKTTLMRIVLKLLKPTSGEVIYHETGERLRFGYLPQKNAIDSRFPVTVREVVEQGLAGNGRLRLKRSACELVGRTIDQVGMTELADQPIGILSGGQLQRVLLARAIIGRPQVLVLDEPLSYLDKTFEQQFYDIVDRLSSTTTILLVSHEMSAISDMATRHLIVNGGLEECSAHRHGVRINCE